MRPRLSGLHLVVCAAFWAGLIGCDFEREGLKGKIAAPGVVGDKPNNPSGEVEEEPVSKPPTPAPRLDAAPAAPPPVAEDAGVAPDTVAGEDAEPPPPATDTAPPISTRPPECDREIKFPITAVFRSYVPDSDDFTFDNDGYFLVRFNNDIARITYNGTPEMVVKNVVGQQNTIDSLRMLRGGDIVIADYTGQALVRIDPAGQQRKLASLNRPNKLTIGPGGQLFVVGIEGEIYRVDPDSGKFNILGRIDGRLRGLTFSVDYKTLYVSDARNNLLHSLQMRPDGTAEAPRVWARNLGGGPDGLTTDACGNVYVSDHDNSTIRRVTPGATVELIANIDRTTSSIAFGSGKQGWDAKTLYTVSVERGGSYEIKIGVPAAPPPPP